MDAVERSLVVNGRCLVTTEQRSAPNVSQWLNDDQLQVQELVRGAQLAPLAATARCFATDTAMKVATDAVQLFGAAGISNEYPINRCFRDAKVLQIIEGTNQIQRNIVAKSVLPH